MNKYDYAKIRKTGSRVRELMNKNHDTVAAMALLAKVTPSQMSKLLDDKCEWSIEKAIIMSHYFDVPLEYLYYGIDEPKELNHEDFASNFKDMLTDMDKLPEAQQNICYKEMAKKVLEKIVSL